MDDVFVFKTAYDVRDGVGFADVGEELVTQPFAFGCARDQTGDVDELNRGVLHALWFDDVGECIHARVGHFDHADVRLNRAKRVIFSGNAGFGQGVE